MLSLGMEGGSRRRRHHKGKHSTKGKKRKSVGNRAFKSTRKMLKRARKLNKSLIKLMSPKRMYN